MIDEKKMISIHALRGEGDGIVPHNSGEARFLSTPSVGRATATGCARTPGCTFLSTPSVGRATGARERHKVFHVISIHALRGEGDCKSA